MSGWHSCGFISVKIFDYGFCGCVLVWAWCWTRFRPGYSLCCGHLKHRLTHSKWSASLYHGNHLAMEMFSLSWTFTDNKSTTTTAEKRTRGLYILCVYIYIILFSHTVFIFDYRPSRLQFITKRLSVKMYQKREKTINTLNNFLDLSVVY